MINGIVHKMVQFIDGEGYDQLLNTVTKGLFYFILVFCVPYFLYLLF
ncbi:hypothetical protein ABET51_08050 [Metabacillus fastidiosus]|nr:hypothetical protein [Metabacillus fastidiosus]